MPSPQPAIIVAPSAPPLDPVAVAAAIRELTARLDRAELAVLKCRIGVVTGETDGQSAR